MGYQRDEQVRWHHGELGMFLESPFNKDFVEDMKKEVPVEERKWDKGRKQWWISDLYLDEVDIILFRHFEKSGVGRE